MKILLLVSAFCLVCVRAAEPDRINGFIVAGHAWSWGKGTVFEALDATKAAGCDTLEVFLMGQKLSVETGDLVLDENLPDDVLPKLKAKCEASGVRILNAYIGQKQWTRIGQDEGQLRRFFEFGKKLGVTGFTGEPAPAQWDMVEKLVKEFGVTFSIHNHAKGFEADYFGGPYPYVDPSKTASMLNEQKRDARLGLCLDTGHVARSGLDVTAVTKACAGRIISAHLKDVARVKLNDVRFGTGMVDVAAVLAELRRQKITGHIALEYESFDSPTFAEDLRSLVDFIRAHPTAAFPAPKLPDLSTHGRHIQRTMRLLAESTPAQRYTVRVLFYGQSITAQKWTQIVERDLRARFPHAHLIVENRALGGFASQNLVNCVETDVVSFQPDLLIFHVFGSHDKYEDILRLVRQRTTAEILQQNDHLSAKDDINEDTDPAKATPKLWSGFMNFNWLPKLSAKYGTEFCDQRSIWKQYLRDNGLTPRALLRDGVHLNEQGDFLMAEIVKAHLRHDPKLGPAPAEDWVKTLQLGKDVAWKDGRVRIEFDGTGVEVIVGSSRDSKPLTFTIDGHKPSEFPELYAFTRAVPKPGGAWPALAPMHAEKPLLLEHWSMQVHRADAEGKRFTFSLCGSKTGPDGEGSSDQRFVPPSGRVVIEPADWNVAYALSLAQVKPVPEQFTVNWSIVPRFTDELTFAWIQPNDRMPTQPEHNSRVTVANGLPPGKHTLEITGDATAPLIAIRIHTPPLTSKP